MVQNHPGYNNNYAYNSQALKDYAKNSSEVILAGDSDREGEAISWHIAKVLGLSNSSKRIIFHEITKNALENALGLSAIKEFLPMQPGDVPATSADTSALEDWIGFKPNTSITDGINRFVNWYRNFYSVF